MSKKRDRELSSKKKSCLKRTPVDFANIIKTFPKQLLTLFFNEIPAHYLDLKH